MFLCLCNWMFRQLRFVFDVWFHESLDKGHEATAVVAGGGTLLPTHDVTSQRRCQTDEVTQFSRSHPSRASSTVEI